MNNIKETSSQFHQEADHHSIQCFYNSFLREWKNWKHDEMKNEIQIDLEKSILVLPLSYYSLIGRHTYQGDIALVDKATNEQKKIDFDESVDAVLLAIKDQFKATDESITIFKTRVLQSRDHMEQSFSLRQEDFLNLYKSEHNDFISAEQALYVGHTFHPHPKNRDGFSEAESKRYSPELGGEFALSWLSINKKYIHEFSSKYFEDKEWMKKLFKKDHSVVLENNHEAFLVHPYQKQFILKHPKLQKLINEKAIQDLNLETKENWKSTTSLRSIYNVNAPYMLKFSLSVRLTNSIRHLLPHEVIRGVQVVDVFQTEHMQGFLKEHANFNVIKEPAFMALKDESGEILEETIISLRENPFLDHKEDCYVLATLTQDHPNREVSLLGEQLLRRRAQTHETNEVLAHKWFDQYLKVAFNPLLLSQAKYGVLFGAHQQNIILELEDGLPIKGHFRDCQGTGYSQYGFNALKNSVDFITEDNGNVLNEEITNTLIPYYLYVNSTLNIIASLARDLKVSEFSLLGRLKENLNELKKDKTIQDLSCLNYLLENPFIQQKGNFLCSIVDMNENTTENPFVIYNKMFNPLSEIN